jgi:carboxylate-amine ligase
VRPHHAFGTVEVRICDAQPTARESTALAGLMVATVAQTALDIDSGRSDGERLLRDREIEENLWRAIRYGMEGRMIDFRSRQEVETTRALDDLLEWSTEAREGLGIDIDLPAKNGARRAQDALAQGHSIETIYRAFARETALTFAPASASAGGSAG